MREHFYFSSFGINYNHRIAVAQMQWRGWSTYSDIVAVWSWLDTEQSMINFTAEIVKVFVRACVHAWVCTCICVCVPVQVCMHMGAFTCTRT